MERSAKINLTQVFYGLDQIDFFLIFFILIGAFLLIILIQKMLPWVAEKAASRFRSYLLPLVPILRLIILFLSVLIVAPLVIKPTLQNFLAIFGAVGLAIGFAFKDYISSLIAGVIAIYEQPYRLGDWVKIDEVYGEVKSMGLRSIKILTPDDTLVTIPHAKIWMSGIQNANSGKRYHLCIANFYLHPDQDRFPVRRAFFCSILQETEGLKAE